MDHKCFPLHVISFLRSLLDLSDVSFLLLRRSQFGFGFDVWESACFTLLDSLSFIKCPLNVGATDVLSPHLCYQQNSSVQGPATTWSMSDIPARIQTKSSKLSSCRVFSTVFCRALQLCGALHIWLHPGPLNHQGDRMRKAVALFKKLVSAFGLPFLLPIALWVQRSSRSCSVFDRGSARGVG